MRRSVLVLVTAVAPKQQIGAWSILLMRQGFHEGSFSSPAQSVRFLCSSSTKYSVAARCSQVGAESTHHIVEAVEPVGVLEDRAAGVFDLADHPNRDAQPDVALLRGANGITYS